MAHQDEAKLFKNRQSEAIQTINFQFSIPSAVTLRVALSIKNLQWWTVIAADLGVENHPE